MATQHINPEGVSPPTNYTHVVAAEGKRVVFISGQVPVNPKGEVAGSDLRSQAEQVFENLKACLGSVGAGFGDVVKLNTYVVNYQPEHRNIIGELRQKYLPPTNPPASTLIGVQALARPELLIEIEAVAVLQ